MENNVMEKDTQAFTSRSNFIVEIQTKQKMLMRNVPKQRDGRAYFLYEIVLFFLFQTLFQNFQVAHAAP